MTSYYQMYSDGGARGNPGPAGIGVLIKDETGQVIAKIAKYLGELTNNQAEYKALIAGLTKAKELGIKHLKCYLDSELVVKQLKREYKIKNKDLAPLFLEAYNLSLSFTSLEFIHVMRENNSEADALVNQALDKALGLS